MTSVKQAIKTLLDRLPYISSLRAQVDELGLFPAGHYYSPIPSRSDVERGLRGELGASDVTDVDLRHDEQLTLLQELSQYYPDMPFPETKRADCRFSFDQSWFCYTDAIVLYGFLRHFKPARIIEVGSGYSSAVMLDTLDRFPGNTTSMTLIEPYPDRLESLLMEGDRERVELIERKIQDVDIRLFDTLESGDLLFVDSSHVMKFGSDLQRIMFEILPRLPVGVHVHFHDIFYPFEYPQQWLKVGRYWNECYLLRAFLSGNASWQITLFNHYANLMFSEFLDAHMPWCARNSGGSLYLLSTCPNS